jgi:hypothetical protein
MYNDEYIYVCLLTTRRQTRLSAALEMAGRSQKLRAPVILLVCRECPLGEVAWKRIPQRSFWQWFEDVQLLNIIHVTYNILWHASQVWSEKFGEVLSTKQVGHVWH